MKIHIDIDSFFVSAHRISDKSLLNIPVVVGKRGDIAIFSNKKHSIISLNRGAFVNNLIHDDTKYSYEKYFLDGERVRGMVVTASYEARVLGIKTGVTLNEAMKICPHLKVLVPKYRLYHELSHSLKKFLQSRVPTIEQYSIDEFFGDLNGWIADENTLNFIQNLRDEIQKELNLPVSIGASRSKWTAKLATTAAKPYGVMVVEDVDSFIKDIPIEKFPGIGKVFSKKIREYGISTLSDIKNSKDLLYRWKKPGINIYNRVCGVDEEEVIERNPQKSLGISRKFDPINCREELHRRVVILSRHLAFLINKRKVSPINYYLKISYASQRESKKRIRVNRVFHELLLKKTMIELFKSADIYAGNVVAIAIYLSNFKKITNLFYYEEDEKLEKLDISIDFIRQKYGVDIIKSGSEYY